MKYGRAFLAEIGGINVFDRVFIFVTQAVDTYGDLRVEFAQSFSALYAASRGRVLDHTRKTVSLAHHVRKLISPSRISRLVQIVQQIHTTNYPQKHYPDCRQEYQKAKVGEKNYSPRPESFRNAGARDECAEKYTRRAAFVRLAAA